MEKIRIVLPEGWSSQHGTAEWARDLRLPAWETLLARGRRQLCAAESAEAALCRAFGVSADERGEWPLAALTRQADGLPGAAGDYWLRADPVHLALQRDKVLALPAGAITREEAAAWTAALNAHLAAEGVSLFTPQPQRGYLRTRQPPGILTVPLSQVLGRDIRQHQPQGEQARYWQRLSNEIQMVLHAHPLNAAREARGQLPVNALWLWGAGQAAATGCDWTRVESDWPLAELLAHSAGRPFSAWSGRWVPDSGRQWLFFGGLQHSLWQGDRESWRTALQQFEQGYARPLLSALRRGQLRQLELELLTAEASLRYELTPLRVWQIWRRPQPLLKLVQ